MIIPYTFKLGHHQYRVLQIPEVPDCARGDVRYPPASTIRLSTHRFNERIPLRRKTQTFWHEVVHAILFDMGQHTLNHDERFVDGFAKRLTQVVYTARLP